MSSITGPGAGNHKLLKQTQDYIRRLLDKDQATDKTLEELLEAIKEITNR